MNPSEAALQTLQHMMGREGAVFMRDLPVNYFPRRNTVQIPWDKVVDPAVFQELKETGCIQSHIVSYDFEQWRMTEFGRQALKGAGMETKPGRLTQDDVGWLTGTGRYAQ